MTNADSAPVMRRTTDFEAMRALALRSGLEDGSFAGYQVAYGYYSGDVLVACAGLKLEAGIFSVECLSVSDGYRGRGMGRSLVSMIEREARNRGAKKIWALARAPDFFVHLGFSKVDPGGSEGPTLKSCMTCPQYGRTCSPAVVCKTL